MFRKELSTFLLIFVIVNINLVIPRVRHICYCPDNFPEGYRCMCNCPKCVANRGGFVSFCTKQERGKPKSDIPILSSGCSCGAKQVDFDAPGSVFPMVLGSSFSPPLPVIHFIQKEASAVPREIYLSPREKPT
jgi:hypothetical protein